MFLTPVVTSRGSRGPEENFGVLPLNALNGSSACHLLHEGRPPGCEVVEGGGRENSMAAGYLWGPHEGWSNNLPRCHPATPQTPQTDRPGRAAAYQVRECEGNNARLSPERLSPDTPSGGEIQLEVRERKFKKRRIRHLLGLLGGGLTLIVIVTLTLLLTTRRGQGKTTTTAQAPGTTTQTAVQRAGGSSPLSEGGSDVTTAQVSMTRLRSENT